MNILLYILLATFSSATIPVHDVPMAVFRLSKSDSNIQLEVTFDIDDLSQALNTTEDLIGLKKVEAYLLKHSRFEFDNKLLRLSLIDMKVLKDHVRFTGVFDGVSDNTKTLKITNSCLIDVPSHSNIMMINLNNTTRDYRMHKGRVAISIEY